jgi:hypothetical protein
MRRIGCAVIAIVLTRHVERYDGFLKHASDAGSAPP